MKMHLRAFLFASAAIIFSAGPVFSEGKTTDSAIRVAIIEKADSMIVYSEEGISAVDPASGKEIRLQGQTSYFAQSGQNGVSLGDSHLSETTSLNPLGGKLLSVNGRKYRGSVILKKSGENKITAINELGLDEYIYGVLPLEISSDWHEDALKTQAVVSRTFALKNLKRHESEGFNLCSRVHCQVYGGYSVEKESTNRAVDETKNEIIEYNGELINSVFFSNCGGKTEKPTDAWDTDFQPPYLKVVRCKYCRKNKHYRWETRLSRERICEALKKSGYNVELPIKSISISKYGKSGRAKFLKIKNGKGTLTIRAGHFRMSLNPDVIRSTFFTEIKKVKGGFYFEGKGWGHGVGLCQEGSEGMAAKGVNYKKIIQFYYPGTKVRKLED